MAVVSAEKRIALRRILTAVDFSSASTAALRYAITVAHAYDARIYLAHVIRPDVYQLVAPEAVGAVLEQTRRFAEQQMAKILVSGLLRGVPHQVLLGQGAFWSVLSTMIQEHEIDLVVVGTHGRTGLEKALLGSVAEQVFRLATCPVMTVGPHVRGETMPEDVRLGEILYATDFTPEADHAAAYALSLAQEHQANLTLLHVVRGEVGPVASLEEEVLNRLESLVPAGADLWCRPEYAVEFGDAADEILSAAEERKVDLIVLGVRHPAHSISHLPPATAYKVVCRSPCPVFTVRG